MVIILQLTKFISYLYNSYVIGSCSKLMKMLQLKEDQFKMYEFDSRIGLNGQ